MLKKISTDAFLMTVGVMFNKIAILFINVLLARYTNSEIYGKFALLRNTINLIETTLSSSVNPIVIHASAKAYGNDENYRKTNTLLFILGATLSIAISAVIWMFDEKISVYILNEENPRYIHLGILLLLSSTISGLASSFVITSHSTLNLPIASITSTIIAVLSAYLLIPNNALLWAILSIAMLHGIEFLIKFSILIYKKIISIHKISKLEYESISTLSKSILILIISSAINALAFWMLRVMLVKGTSNFTPLAIFDVSFQYIAVEMMVINNIVTIFHNRATNQFNRDQQQHRSIFFTGIKLISLATITAMMVNFLFADFLIGLYGNNYEPKMLRILTFILPLYAMAVFMNRNFLTNGRQKVLLLVSILSSIFTLLYANIFMKGTLQLALSFMIYFGVSNIIYLLFVMHSHRRKQYST